MHICFVCTGNICRSPMAALMFAERARVAGLDVRVSSAGTDGWHAGEPAHPRTVRVLARNGYPTAHVAARVDDSHLSADLLVAMDPGHVRALRAMGAERVRLLREFDPNADGLEVPDPYYGTERDYEAVYAMIDAACAGLLEWVRATRS